MEATNQKTGILSKGTTTTINLNTQSEPIEWKLPKTDITVQKSSCGTGHGMLGCPNGHKESRKPLIYHCDNPLCPTCGDHWIMKQTKRAVERLKAAEEMYAKAGKPLKRIRHISFNPPYEEGMEAIKTVKGYRKFKAKAIKIIKTAGKKTDKKYGIVGGCMVFHACRYNDPKKLNYRPDFPDNEYYLFPHFHTLGYGFLLNADEFKKETGWLYRNHGIREDLGGTISYELGHCGIGKYDYDKKFYVTTWFGALGYNQLKKDGETVTTETIECEVCGEKLHRYGNVFFVKRYGEDEEEITKDMEDEGLFSYKKRVPIFILKKPPMKYGELDGN